MNSPYLCSAGKDHSSGQAEPIEMGLDDCLEYIADDELVEVVTTFTLSVLYPFILDFFE